MVFPPRFTIMYMAALLVLALSGCAGTVSHQATITTSPIGPYPSFSGRLIVMQPTKRWQVSLQWQANTSEQGRLRITHAATATVVELRWQGESMHIRDNQHPDWRYIEAGELSEHGIIIPPNELAAILLGHMPAHFIQKDEQTWESRQSGRLIRLRWQQELRRLTMTDIKHGLKAVLNIQP